MNDNIVRLLGLDSVRGSTRAYGYIGNVALNEQGQLVVLSDEEMSKLDTGALDICETCYVQYLSSWGRVGILWPTRLIEIERVSIVVGSEYDEDEVRRCFLAHVAKRTERISPGLLDSDKAVTVTTLWTGYFHNAAFLLAGGIVTAALWRRLRLRWMLRHGPGHCICGYDLQQLCSDRCPECGRLCVRGESGRGESALRRNVGQGQSRSE
ncbi:MAG: hypothetical protein SYC29_16915 [Planctomycetota bacterium]|nr:hypothetical protein [Planctomycetota bacterium]